MLTHFTDSNSAVGAFHPMIR